MKGETFIFEKGLLGHLGRQKYFIINVELHLNRKVDEQYQVEYWIGILFSNYFKCHLKEIFV